MSITFLGSMMSNNIRHNGQRPSSAKPIVNANSNTRNRMPCTFCQSVKSHFPVERKKKRMSSRLLPLVPLLYIRYGAVRRISILAPRWAEKGGYSLYLSQKRLQKYGVFITRPNIFAFFDKKVCKSL